MTHDPTETIRRELIATDAPELQAAMASALEEQTWDTAALAKEFTVTGFLAPFVVVRRKSDGKTGTLMFKHSPRVYFSWQEDPA